MTHNPINIEKESLKQKQRERWGNSVSAAKEEIDEQNVQKDQIHFHMSRRDSVKKRRKEKKKKKKKCKRKENSSLR